MSTDSSALPLRNPALKNTLNSIDETNIKVACPYPVVVFDEQQFTGSIFLAR
jgi:hypothetical protein